MLESILGMNKIKFDVIDDQIYNAKMKHSYVEESVDINAFH